RYQRQVADTPVEHRLDHSERKTRSAEAAHHDGVAVLDAFHGRGRVFNHYVAHRFVRRVCYGNDLGYVADRLRPTRSSSISLVPSAEAAIRAAAKCRFRRCAAPAPVAPFIRTH